MGFSEMYVKWVDEYVRLIDSTAQRKQFKAVAPILLIMRNKLIESKVKT
jgi:hypothetical protein